MNPDDQLKQQSTQQLEKPLVIKVDYSQVPPPTPAPVHPAQPMEIPKPVIKQPPMVSVPPKRYTGLVKTSIVVATLSLIISIGIGTYSILELNRLQQDIILRVDNIKKEQELKEQKEYEDFKTKVTQNEDCKRATCYNCSDNICECHLTDDNGNEKEIICYINIDEEN